ncbi:hypothetical protein [Bernardetia sp.]|uniref:hypothetical protein n=1 Tax=Bernardetia sp. TaxID=1937974 RepID=UPI0025C2563D|nr:hypothetical protein [Bernardetia sp.]
MQHQLSAIDGSIYILELSEPFGRLELQEVPKEIAKQRTGNYATVDVPGRNNPLHHYTGGGDTFSMSCQFVYDGSNEDTVLRDINWLEGLIANDSYNAPTRKVKVIFGNLFSNKTYIVKSVSSKFTDFDNQNGWKARRAEVSISFELSMETNRSINDIRQF